MGKRIEIQVGQRFGRWTVISEPYSQTTSKGKVVRYVNCQCDCGNTKEVLITNLTRGASKSCGCTKIHDIVKQGDVYGCLTVLRVVSPHIQRNGCTVRRVECQCQCGTIKTYLLPSLKHGKTVSCGCYHREKSHNRKQLIFNKGINDCDSNIKIQGVVIPSYIAWKGILERCYDEKILKTRPTYQGCSVCDEWLYFSNFKKWFDGNYNPDTMQGWHVDKDILVKGNKVYSPDTCCLVPNEINQLFTSRKRGDLPRGVALRGKKFASYLQTPSRRVAYIGIYDTPHQAFEAYKELKEAHFKQVAEEWKGVIASNVYNAIKNYQLNIND